MTQLFEQLGLACIRCGESRAETLLLTMFVGESKRPSVLIAYSRCALCEKEACDTLALAAIREAVAEIPRAEQGYGPWCEVHKGRLSQCWEEFHKYAYRGGPCPRSIDKNDACRMELNGECGSSDCPMRVSSQ